MLTQAAVFYEISGRFVTLKFHRFRLMSEKSQSCTFDCATGNQSMHDTNKS